MASGAAAAWIAGQRLHLQHGPIDLIIDADGAADKVGAAFAAAGLSVLLNYCRNWCPNYRICASPPVLTCLR